MSSPHLNTRPSHRVVEHPVGWSRSRVRHRGDRRLRRGPGDARRCAPGWRARASRTVGTVGANDRGKSPVRSSSLACRGAPNYDAGRRTPIVSARRHVYERFRARLSHVVSSFGACAISRARRAASTRSSRAPLLATFSRPPPRAVTPTTPCARRWRPRRGHNSHLPELTGTSTPRPPSGAIHFPAPDTQGHAFTPLERASSRRSCRLSPPPAALHSTRSPRCWPRRASPPSKNPRRVRSRRRLRRAAPGRTAYPPASAAAAPRRAAAGPGATSTPTGLHLRRVPSENPALDDTRGRDKGRAQVCLCDATVPQVATVRRQD